MLKKDWFSTMLYKEPADAAQGRGRQGQRACRGIEKAAREDAGLIRESL